MNGQTVNPNSISTPVSLTDFIAQQGKLCIPRIQRAYAQGRPHEKLIRANFLGSLFNALCEEKPLELNFVYGSKNGDRFEVLDGQQRLTTLVLLHWYCANVEMDYIPTELGKLSYETRPSSAYFIQQLIKGKIDLNEAKPSVAIQRKRWFSYSYKCDPTVISMLGMLDAIHEEYGRRKNMLTSPETFRIYNHLSLIKFYAHSLDGYSHTDELYIKMNARGLPLSPFENFKADLDGWLRKQTDGGYDADVSYGGRTMKWWQRFLAKIDTTWTTFLWQRGAENCRTADARLNEQLFRVFIRYLLFRYITNNVSEAMTPIRADDDVFAFLDDDKFGAESQTEVYLGFDRYSTVLSSDPDALKKLEKVLDGFVSADLTLASLDAMLRNPHDALTNRSMSWLSSKRELTRSQTVAISAGLAYWEIQNTYDEIKFKQWMRVVWNAVENYNIDNIDAQIRITRALVRLVRMQGMESDVYGTLAGVADPDLLTPVKEEILKAKLIVSSNQAGREEWEREIINAERAPFFRGMIGFYIQDNMTLEVFKHRRENVKLLFDNSGIAPSYRERHRLLRAMLAQIPFWNGGVRDLMISENRMTKDAYLKNFLAAKDPVQIFFRRIADLPGEREMYSAIDAEIQNIPALTGVSDDELSYAQHFYKKLVGDEKVWSWAAEIERQKGKTPTIQFLYGHYMLNARKSRSARLVLDSDREDMVGTLISDLGFELVDEDQRQALEQYGYFTDVNLSLTKNVNGCILTVRFSVYHELVISYSERQENFEYGLIESFQLIRNRIEEIINGIQGV